MITRNPNGAPGKPTDEKLSTSRTARQTSDNYRSPLVVRIVRMVLSILFARAFVRIDSRRKQTVSDGSLGDARFLSRLVSPEGLYYSMTNEDVAA